MENGFEQTSILPLTITWKKSRILRLCSRSMSLILRMQPARPWSGIFPCLAALIAAWNSCSENRKKSRENRTRTTRS